MDPGLPIALFRLPDPSLPQLVALGVTLLGILVVLMAWHTVESIRDRRVRRRLLLHRIADRAHEKGLAPDEAALYERIALTLGALPGARTFEEMAARLEQQGVSHERLAALREKIGLHHPVPAQRLLSMRDCAPGQDVSLTDAEHAWRAGVVSVDAAAIALKVPAEAAAHLTPRDVVKVSFWRELDARYFFLSRVLSVTGSPIPVVRLEHPARLDRFQDREFYRADVHWRVFLVKADRAAWEEAVAGREQEKRNGPSSRVAARFEGTIIDISPGGFRMAPLPDLFPDDHLLVEMPFPEKGPAMTLHARVIAVESDGIRCEFLNLTLREQDLIHHEILHQRRTRKS